MEKRLWLFQALLFLLMGLAAQVKGAQLTDTSQVAKLLPVKISFTCSETRVKDILFRIGEQENISFAYSDAMPSLQQTLSIHFENTPLSVVLDSLFSNTEIGYFQMEDVIVLIRKSQIESLDVDSQKVFHENLPEGSLPTDSTTYEKLTLTVTGKARTNSSPHLKTFFLRTRKKFSLENPLTKQEAKDSLMYDSVAARPTIPPANATTYTKREDQLPKNDSIAKRGNRRKIRSYGTSPGNPTFKRWALGITYGALKSYWKMSVNNSPQAAPADNLGIRNNYGGPDKAWQAGISLSYRFTKLFFAEANVLYASFDREGTHTDYFTTIQPQNSTTTTTTYSYHDQYNYLSIPLLLGIRKGERRLYAGVATGISLDFLHSSSAPAFYDTYVDQFYFDNSRPGQTTDRPTPIYNTPPGLGQRPGFNNFKFYINQQQTQDLNPIKMQLRNFNYKFILKAEIGLRLKPFEVVVSPIIMYMGKSLYGPGAPVVEKALLTGINLSTRVTF